MYRVSTQTIENDFFVVGLLEAKTADELRKHTQYCCEYRKNRYETRCPKMVRSRENLPPPNQPTREFSVVGLHEVFVSKSFGM